MHSVRQNQSPAWQHFEKLAETEQARCLHCKTIISCRGFTTSGLFQHLQRKHDIDARSSVEAAEPPEKIPKTKIQRQSSITSYVKKESLEEVISKLAAQDGIPIHAIFNSQFIRSSVSDKGFKLPSSEARVMALIHQQFETVKEKMKLHFDERKNDNIRFSLSMDEYTSLKNRRYMNINLHEEGKHFNLGMIRMAGSFPAEKCLKILETHLVDFGVNLKSEIVCVISDGASVMKKLGQMSATEHQLCYAHALHLAVCDVIYANAQDDDDDAENSFDEEENAEDDEDEEEAFNENIEPVAIEAVPPSFIPKLDSVMKKVRTIVNMFKRSPLKNELLQKYVQLEFGKELTLIRDCKTRWNSMLNMIERFLQLRKAITKSLVDLSMDMNLGDEEFELLEEVKFALQPIKLGVEALCRQDATLLTADGIFRFIFSELKKRTSTFVLDIIAAVDKRIQQRRQSDLVSLLRFLHDPDCFNDPDDVFAMPSKKVLQRTAKRLLSRLFPNQDIQNNEDSGVHDESIVEEESLVDKLNCCIRESTSVPSKKLPEVSSAMEKEFKVFEATGKRTPNLDHLYKALLTIPPTSVEAERAFSAAGLFITKLRCRLSDKSINALCFLRSYYLNKEK